jgi:hypothetical protein
MKHYLISKKKLLSLLEDSFRLCALECGGVDNWSWYGNSVRDYLDTYIRANHIEFEDEEDEWDFSFDDIAEREIKKYENN